MNLASLMLIAMAFGVCAFAAGVYLGIRIVVKFAAIDPTVLQRVAKTADNIIRTPKPTVFVPEMSDEQAAKLDQKTDLQQKIKDIVEPGASSEENDE